MTFTKLSPMTVRLAAFYAASFLIVGIQLPFWPVWLSGRGLDASEIATVFAAALWAKVAVTPAIGALADRLGGRRAVMVGLAATALGFYVALLPAAGFWPILWLSLAAGVAQSALMPLGDSITLAAVRERGFDYGRIRVWGSVSFIVAALASGLILAVLPGAAPGNRVLWLVLGGIVLLLGACLALPPAGSPLAATARWAALAGFAANRRFWLFVVSASALQSSHQLYYGFGTLYWRRLGFSAPVIGALWAEGVLAEIALFWLGGRLTARLGPFGLMALSGIAGIVRWSLAGILPGLPAAAMLQLLHALTFGAAHLGAMMHLSRTVPPDAAASAQTLYAAVSAGLGSGLVMLGAGALYARFGGHAYLFMAGISALGLAGVARLARLSAG
ncbi:MAG TPA: MFS transporter [Stellaceae bacterium]|nr:MFS transporter [Stellaceae bacterium]